MENWTKSEKSNSLSLLVTTYHIFQLPLLRLPSDVKKDIRRNIDYSFSIFRNWFPLELFYKVEITFFQYQWKLRKKTQVLFKCRLGGPPPTHTHWYSHSYCKNFKQTLESNEDENETKKELKLILISTINALLKTEKRKRLSLKSTHIVIRITWDQYFSSTSMATPVSPA